MPLTAELAEPMKVKEISFKRILFATDFTDASNRALNHAVAFAKRYDAELLVVHAVAPEPREPVPLDPLPRELDAEWMEADQEMARLAKSAAFDGVAHKEIVRRGDVVDVIADVIRKQKCDLLLTGTHGRRGLAKIALGSIAEQILHMTECPVLTVGPGVPAIPKDGIKISKILFATDFGPASQKAFPYALAFANSFHAKLVLLHMIEPMPASEVTPAAYGPPAYAAEEFSKWEEKRIRESQKRLQALAENVDLPFAPVLQVGTDLVPEGILEAAKSAESDLIVMGVNHTDSPKLASHFPWVLTSEVIRKAKCPVLTVCV